LEEEGHDIHTPFDCVAAIVVEYVFSGQLVHAALPVAPLYVPAAHAEQSPPFGPVYPSIQAQSLIASLPAGELESVGHV
jgi:hypothetical protein